MKEIEYCHELHKLSTKIVRIRMTIQVKTDFSILPSASRPVGAETEGVYGEQWR